MWCYLTGQNNEMMFIIFYISDFYKKIFQKNLIISGERKNVLQLYKIEDNYRYIILKCGYANHSHLYWNVWISQHKGNLFTECFTEIYTCSVWSVVHVYIIINFPYCFYPPRYLVANWYCSCYCPKGGILHVFVPIFQITKYCILGKVGCCSVYMDD